MKYTSRTYFHRYPILVAWVSPFCRGVPDGGTIKTVALLCTGTATASSVDSFDLTFQIESLGESNRSVEGHASKIARQKPRNSEVSGCDKPGDVVEQGFCLE
ncbi:hypothetical protein SAMN04488002_0161 [Litoreibacter janthinus]|uniref:Uncharacterized protein n=1 Tax=Litoreibacter janthinus TaxID=670154 RepID=A0A1I6FRN7_9RHOB|nr:hypothetical protein SAMN04488002_0161 [Litoreibacter janthinus]